MLARWQHFTNATSSGHRNAGGLTLVFERRGDAHLDCNVSVSVEVRCDRLAPSAPAAAAVSGVQNECQWDLLVKTSSPAVC